MADCSATGTALDRAASVVLGRSSGPAGQEAAKHVGAVFGHAVVAPTMAPPMMAAPDYLVMPSNGKEMANVGPKVSQLPSTHIQAPGGHQAAVSQASPHGTMMMIPHQHQQQQHHHGQVAMLPNIHPLQPVQKFQHQHAPLQAAFHHQQFQYQQQQQQAFNILMHQQQLMNQQMLEMTSHMHNQKIQSTAAKSHMKESATVVQESEENWENWHDGLDEADAYLAQENDEYFDGHEGNVRGATIEQLAAAWAQAEAEYDDQFPEQVEDPANLWPQNMSQEELLKYEFVNKETPEETLDWMGEGLRQFNEGDLRAAIKSFEMELQHNNPDNAYAWRMLGRCYAENDQDPEAIRCLETAVDRDPYSPDALLALGVSYVNELNHERALENIKAWFTHNPKYAGLEMPPDIYGTETGKSKKESAFDEVKQLLLSALDYDPTDAADIHEALGVMYNVVKDYDEAVASFRRALELRPDDYQLWNKIGATLANGSQSDQALPSYHKALQIKPKYARAWLNMAISHSNLQDHHEAARCYLQTLSLNPAATHCWTYLRMSLSCSERWDLLPSVFAQDLQAFKDHYDFVLY